MKKEKIIEGKSIDELLIENGNLHEAVAVLIQSVIDNSDREALYKWDKLRAKEYK